MRAPLLALALTVDRHDDGGFFWAIIESFDRSDFYQPLIEASVASPTYVAALRAGYAALLNLADDVDTGPLADPPFDGDDNPGDR